MMEILASSILQTVIPELEYKHLCVNQRKYTSDEAILGFDWTPFQTTFKQATLGVDTDLCKSCDLEKGIIINYFDSSPNATREIPILPLLTHVKFQMPSRI